MKHYAKKAAKVAAVVIALKFSGCGAVLQERLMGVKKREITYCDLCSTQDIYNKYRASELFSVKDGCAEFMNSDGDIVWGIKDFEIKKKDVFLDFLKRNYKKLPKKLFRADKIIVRGNVAQKAVNGETTGDPLSAQKKFISLGGEYAVSVRYKTGNKWEKTSIPASTCLNQFFLGEAVFESRKQLIEDGVINPEEDCKIEK